MHVFFNNKMKKLCLGSKVISPHAQELRPFAVEGHIFPAYCSEVVLFERSLIDLADFSRGSKQKLASSVFFNIPSTFPMLDCLP